jgi:hypothetical protein
MRQYYNPAAYAVGGGTVEINGDRGAAASVETLSENFWGATNDRIPPLVVRVKDKGSFNRVAWEHHSSWRRSTVIGWEVICMSSGQTVLATLSEDSLVYNDDTGCSQYAVRATYNDGKSGIAYTESPQ